MTARPKLSIVIPFRNEGEEPYRTLESIRDTSRDVEVIFIEDGPLTYSFGKDARNYATGYQRGTCYARDYGMTKVSSDNVLMIDAHMRFDKDHWADKIVDKLRSEPQTIFCTRMKGLNWDGTASGKYYQGATVQMFAEGKNGREIIAEKWLRDLSTQEFPEVPIVMGGNYAFNKQWYDKIKGFNGLSMFGNIQSYISFKSWMFGGKVKCLNTVQIAHKFKEGSQHNIPLFYSLYNRLYTMLTLFDKELREKCIDYLDNDNIFWQQAWALVNKNVKTILKDREYYDNRIDIRNTFRKFDIDF